MSKFKVGDRVRITKCIFGFKVGEIHEIADVSVNTLNDLGTLYKISRDNYLWNFYGSELELVQSHKSQVIDQMNKDKELLDSLLGPAPNDGFVVLKPDEKWIPTTKIEGKFTERSCTCGIDSIGGGLHSDYCDKVGL